MTVSVQVLQARIRVLRGCAGVYTTHWVCRAFLFALTGATGTIQLDSGSVGVRMLSRMAPDQRQWLWRLTGVEGTKRMSIDKLFALVKYSGPIELFSMWACLCSGISSAQVVGREQVLRDKCTAFQQQHGWSPHPAVLVQMAV
jgi:hypothetical protein